PLQELRMLFDLVPTATDDDWASVAARMEALPRAFAGYRESLLEGVQRRCVAALRQVDRCAEQCDTYAGRAGGTGFFAGMAAAAERDGKLGERLAAAAVVADGAFA